MGYTPEAIRYQLAHVPYRNKLNFTFDGLTAAATALERLRNYKLRLETAKFSDGENTAVTEATRKASEAFDEAMDADLNTAEALGAIFEFVRVTNTAMDSGDFKAGNAAGARQLLAHFDAVFQVLEPTVAAGAKSDTEVQALVDERTQAKKARNFKRADEIRDQLAAEGIVIEDTRDGVRWKRK
jgi:cysteinyl-tRNA synthetase